MNLNNIKKIIFTTIDKITTGAFILSCLILGGIVFIVCLQVIVRYFFGMPIYGIVETVQYGMIWLTFLSVAWILKKEKHVSIDFLTNKLSIKTFTFIKIITTTVEAVMWAIITWYTGVLTWRLILTGERISTQLEPLKWPLVMVIPFGCLLLFFQSLRWLFIHYKNYMYSSENPKWKES